ncbi:MAG TPA: glycoside hydrolase family 15 protein [Acidimicrobiales bacterium]|nr:glycoside hydrolase family 15 protein [Acidimicrobiales bacterium]
MRLRREPAGSGGQRRWGPTPTRRLRLGPRRRRAALGRRARPVRGDLAGHGRLRRSGGTALGRGRRRHLGGRGEPRHFVHSKLMAWLALDRALRLAERHPARTRRRARWAAAREAIAADVVAHGYDEKRQTFVRAYGEVDLDAALLILPVLGLEHPRSPRVAGTVEAVRHGLDAGEPLLYRYPPRSNGLGGREGGFLPCSFWLVQALALMGRVEEAAGVFEALIPFGGGLGLFAEEVDPSNGELLGNYPQALTHAALVQAALALRDATHEGRSGS